MLSIGKLDERENDVIVDENVDSFERGSVCFDTDGRVPVMVTSLGDLILPSFGYQGEISIKEMVQQGALEVGHRSV